MSASKDPDNKETVTLNRSEILEELGDTSNYNKLPDTVQLDRSKIKALIEKEKKAAAEREAAAKRLADEKSKGS